MRLRSSSRSRQRARGPVGKESQLAFRDLRQEFSCPPGTAAQSLVFASQPAHQVLVDAPEKQSHLGRVEPAIVDGPSSHEGVDLLSEVLEGRSGAPMNSPAADRVPYGLHSRQGDRRGEGDEEYAVSVLRRPRPEGVPQKRELFVLVGALAVRVLAVDNTGLLTVQL